jgi:DNA-directed RNA polymerase specialized sigma24 family protein
MNFEEAMMPQMDAAYNLARWLTRNDADAQDMVQEAYLRALRFFSGFRREVVVLRELEELSYKDIAVVLGVPIGTVMSRLARARKRLMLSLPGDNKSDFQSVSAVPE